MKRLAYGLLALVLGFAAPTMTQAYDPVDTGPIAPGAGINGTVHDLPLGQNGLGDYIPEPPDELSRICIYCHAPHNTYRLSTANGGLDGSGPQAADDFNYLPLWNHTLQDNLAYNMYYNGPGAPGSGPKAAQSIVDFPGVPGSTSLLCLSCHDGSVAVNSYGNVYQPTRSQSNGVGFMNPVYQVGVNLNLQNHHPIGFDYEAVQGADPEIRISDTELLTGDPVKNHLYGEANTLMECGTCHSVHNTGNQGESLLWRSDYQSELCLTCHAKGYYTAAPDAPPAP
jgi:predicted CXXCH cytochrome family protein